MPKNKGFTLIELLVVVAIIGLLSSIVLTSLAAARQKAADSEIVQEAQSLKKALELYRSANNKFFENGNNYIRAGVPAEMVSFNAGMAPYIKIPSMKLTSTLTNFHYMPGYLAIASTYSSCGGVAVQSNGYLVFFSYPNTASSFKVEPISGYSCFTND